MASEPQPARSPLSRHATWLAIARASFGVPAVAAPEACLRLLGLSPGRRPNPARHFVGFFGVRELVLGGLLLAARRDLRQLQPLVALGALADIGDTTLLLREIVRRRHAEAGGLVLLGTGLGGSAASVAVWVELQRFFRGA
jgi:single-stranded DNA-specific DHH superfamily exonuclease